MTDFEDQDLRYVNKNRERVSWLETARAYWNGWLYKKELDELHSATSEEEAERLVREANVKIRDRLELWRMSQ